MAFDGVFRLAPRPIHLADLRDATAQEVFDHIVHHQLTQGRKAYLSSGPVLWDDKGNRCAVGSLLTDDDCDKLGDRFRHSGWAPLCWSGWVGKTHSHYDLICECQRVHDRVFVDHWSAGYRDLAERFGLSAHVIDSFKQFNAVEVSTC